MLLLLILLLWCQFLYISIFNSIVAFELVVDAQVCVCVRARAYARARRARFFLFFLLGAARMRVCKCASD